MKEVDGGCGAAGREAGCPGEVLSVYPSLSPLLGTTRGRTHASALPVSSEIKTAATCRSDRGQARFLS